MKNSERSFARRIDLTSSAVRRRVRTGQHRPRGEREFIAASAVSKRLSDLEATVDTALLYRHSRGVTLTPAGESLLHHARNVLYGLERMQGAGCTPTACAAMCACTPTCRPSCSSCPKTWAPLRASTARSRSTCRST
jgi:hypothetical protein